MGNTGEGNGGGLYVVVDCSCEFSIYNNVFTQNEVYGGMADVLGGGFYVEVGPSSGAHVTVYNNVVAENNAATDGEARGGGAAFVVESESTLSLVNNTITSNIASGSMGDSAGGIFIHANDADAVFSLNNNIMWNNTAFAALDIHVVRDGWSSFTITHSIFDDIMVNDVGGEGIVSNSGDDLSALEAIRVFAGK